MFSMTIRLWNIVKAVHINFLCTWLKLQDILTFLPTVYVPSTADPEEVVFKISSLRDETSIKNITGWIINGTRRSTPLIGTITETKNKKGEIVKKFAVETRYDFKYEKARTWNLVFKVCFEEEWMVAADPWVGNCFYQMH